MAKERELKPNQIAKPTYEELEKIAQEASQQADYFLKELHKLNNENMFRRLDYLFSIVANREAFTKEFVEKTIAEIESAITIKTNKE